MSIHRHRYKLVPCRFTCQRLDNTGLYYYGARYYDAGIGRFISPDTIIQNPANPQTLNRYSCCGNNPLTYTDPSGQDYISDHGGMVNNITIIDKVASSNGGFTITSGLVPYDSWWAKTVNIIDQTARLIYNAYSPYTSSRIPGSGLPGYPSDVDISGYAMAYHTSNGLNGVTCNISSSTDIDFNVTLNWTENNKQQSVPMTAVSSDGRATITPYANNSTYGVISNNTMASVSSTYPSSFGGQAVLTTFYIKSTVPNYNDKAVQSMWVTIAPKISQDSRPTAATNYSRPKNIEIAIK